MYFKFNDKNETIINIDKDSILYAYLKWIDMKYSIKLFLKKDLEFRNGKINELIINDYYSNKEVKEDYERLSKALGIKDN